MPESNYDVNARLRLSGDRQAGNRAARVSGQLTQMGAVIRGNTSLASGLTRQLIAMGATYIGLSMIGRTMVGLTRSAMSYTAQIEKTQIGLTSIMQAVEGLDWKAAGQAAGDAFETLKEMSIMSPAGPQEMLNIFQMIVGPMRRAGTEMDRIMSITQATVLAASALNVDYQQASRDMSMIVRGAAGVDVKLFSMLRSTGAIAETTEEWNKNLTAADRVTKLEEALAKFARSGKAFGKSWAGVTSTFKGISNEMKRAAFTPIMAMLADRIGKINMALIANRAIIESGLASWGGRVADTIDRAAQRTQKVFLHIVQNWDTISARISKVVQQTKAMVPMLTKAAAAFAALSVARGVIGGALGAAGSVAGIVAAFGVGGGAVGAAGTAAGVTGGAGAAAGGAAAAGGTAAAGGAAAVLWPVVAALTALAAIGLFVADNFKILKETFVSMTEGMTEEMLALGVSLKKYFAPVLKLVGGVITVVLVPAIMVWIGALRLLVAALTFAFDKLGTVVNWVYETLEPAFGHLLVIFKAVGDAVGALTFALSAEATAIRRLAQLGKFKREAGVSRRAAKEFGTVEIIPSGKVKEFLDPTTKPKKTGGVPGARGGTTINVNKMIIKQEFGNKHRPDRVVHAMLTDITKQAESRISSGFSGALSR